MDAILQVPSAVLVLMGFGVLEKSWPTEVARPPYLGRVHAPAAGSARGAARLEASADVLVMAIQPTTLNHRYTTPQKLFESMAAGVPVVASDLPGMAPIVRATGAGVLCDPTSPATHRGGDQVDRRRTTRGAVGDARPRPARRARAVQLGSAARNPVRVYRELLPTGHDTTREQPSVRATEAD